MVAAANCPMHDTRDPDAASRCDRVTLEEAGLGLNFVAGFAYLNRVAQQRSGLGGGFTPQRVPGPYRGQIAVDGCRTHRLQLGAHLG